MCCSMKTFFRDQSYSSERNIGKDLETECVENIVRDCNVSSIPAMCSITSTKC